MKIFSSLNYTYIIISRKRWLICRLRSLLSSQQRTGVLYHTLCHCTNSCAWSKKFEKKKIIPGELFLDLGTKSNYSIMLLQKMDCANKIFELSEKWQFLFSDWQPVWDSISHFFWAMWKYSMKGMKAWTLLWFILLCGNTGILKFSVCSCEAF